MKIVRSGAFETNSSSTHSLTLNHKQEERTYYMFNLVVNLSPKEGLAYDKLVKAFPFTYEESRKCLQEMLKGHFKATNPMSKFWLLVGIVLNENTSFINQLSEKEEYSKIVYSLLNNHPFTKNLPTEFFRYESIEDFPTWEDLIQIESKDIEYFFNNSFQYDLDSILSGYEKLAQGFYGCIGKYGYFYLNDVILNYLFNENCVYKYWNRDIENPDLQELITIDIQEKEDEDD